MSGGIVFQVEAARVLQILASEIYDSPLAMVRENTQNAYDAVRMRFADSGTLREGGRVDIDVTSDRIVVSDNGIGMDEGVLRSNFWKAGSSGKKSADAKRAGVVGTFGIGAMSNFGVCSRVTVETRAVGQSDVLVSVAERETLRIAEECIVLTRRTGGRDFGTTVTAELDAAHRVTPQRVKEYLAPYVALLPVPVYLNGELVSRRSIEQLSPFAGRALTEIGTTTAMEGQWSGTFVVSIDQNDQVLVRARDLHLDGSAIEGELVLLQSGGHLMGYRSLFGLAPIPAAGSYAFGGIANLGFLEPTAGREALGRSSIDQVSHVVALAEKAVSEVLATTTSSNRNNAFLNWIVAHGRFDLADRVTVTLLPPDDEVELGQLSIHIGQRTTHYYSGSDPRILGTFASEAAYLVRIAQQKPRRTVQTHYVEQVLHIQQVPDSAQITHVYSGSELTLQEASILVRVGAILRDDYLVPDLEVVLADISHGVTVMPKKVDQRLVVYMARDSALLPALRECYTTAYDLFIYLMKDFVRVQIYPKIQDYVPSSTRTGVEELRRLLLRNRELFRYEDVDRGDLEGILGEYLTGTAVLEDVLRAVGARTRMQMQSVSSEQVGPIEDALPGLANSPVVASTDPVDELIARPPILRDDIASDKKILTTRERYPQLGNFRVFLGLSDRLMRTEGSFLRTPHATRILWGGHRVIYIFTETTGHLSLYYDIELRAPIASASASGVVLPTTTLITRDRIFVPVPDELAGEFQVTGERKEFFVRFDVLGTT